MRDIMKRISRTPDAVPVSRVLALAAALSAGVCACGNLDDVTTVKDLRVLAVKSEPAGFLVSLGDPGSAAAADLQATVTALVVDPRGNAQTLTFTADGCPDYIDTITAASGRGSKVCPGADVTSQFPAPIGPALATADILTADAPGTADPAAPSTIEYHPQVAFGLTPSQLGLFFSPAQTGVAVVDASVQFNRDFGLDAIMDLTFNLGTETTSAIKRVVYWPRLADADVPAGFPLPQLPNQNPIMDDVQFFQHRNSNTGDPEDAWPDPMPTLSLSAKDSLYVLPVPAAGAAERYLLRVNNTQTNQIETHDIPRELLVYQFYATAGTFSPSLRQSELSAVLTSTDGRVHIDSQYQPPKANALPPDGKVTIWVTVRDERAGTSWASRTFFVAP
jgi:hypothetical protein